MMNSELKKIIESKRQELTQLYAELVSTDLEDKYYLRHKGIGSWSFLNFNINLQEYVIAGKKHDYTYKTQFTQSEIDEMPECYKHPAVWEQIRVENEEE